MGMLQKGIFMLSRAYLYALSIQEVMVAAEVEEGSQPFQDPARLERVVVEAWQEG